jgi:ribosome-associated toxin RatA of RatAB toxin-antitoxin module
MPLITRSALVAYRPQELFALVNDVESYPQYLPYCVEARVLARADDEVMARIAFSRLGITRGVTTRNRLAAPHRLDIELVEGPFAKLAGSWHFQPLGDVGSKVVFEVDYEVDTQVAQLVAGMAIGEAAGLAVDAFQKRAAQLYGKRV